MPLIDFFHEIGSLKDLKRTGWLMRKVSNPESVADHSFRTAVMALILAPRLKLNTEKCLKMAVLHDLAEARIGDIPGREKEEDQLIRDKHKQAMEKKEYRSFYEKKGGMVKYMGPADFAEFLDRSDKLWKKIFDFSGFKPKK